MRSFAGFSFGKKKKKHRSDDDDTKYNRHDTKTATFGRPKSTYFAVSEEEAGRKRRRMVVSVLIAMALSEDNGIDPAALDNFKLQLLFPINEGFDLPLVIGEHFICKISGKNFQTASYNDCLQFILTTLYEEGYEFARVIWNRLVRLLDDQQKCLLAYHGLECKTRTWAFHEYRNCFVGRDAVTWLVENGLCKSREHAVSLGQGWLQSRHIQHVTDESRQFEDGKFFYKFNDIKFRMGVGAVHENKNREQHEKALSTLMDPNEMKQLLKEHEHEVQQQPPVQQYGNSNSTMHYQQHHHKYSSELLAFSNSPPKLKNTPSFSSKQILDSPRTMPVLFGTH
mmetsp:Transcript_67007/g.106554  ORF Transcript_67007/g.106554 Transcript_67007/m.106554 type:complete len:339 (+) Transcript_67007:34-1050(+)|eukprot:CAMPEP_0197037532 /NCGR_PEP_ID=MMETSP1384-20130603/14718_1 /TAXON_ID=29189 /ORGANISM="Ammonia sp." /LENGTH=338 /DNA_ID=CAMNT_0042467845 /DNA_START=1 /DNA_END=1017 /DNA_ORIENTATION=+